jgi:rSAM/selenodomain-associated transferase 2
MTIAKETSAKVIEAPKKGRAAQMNYGATQARGELLYFLHADSIPPKGFDNLIVKQWKEGCRAGCFQLAFDHHNWLLAFYAWCTRFDIDLFRFGDQSLFIDRMLFAEIGGFREDHLVMEDQEIIKRIRNRSRFKVLPQQVLTSARRYQENGVLRLQLVFTLIVILYKMGFSQQKLLSVYKKLVY